MQVAAVACIEISLPTSSFMLVDMGAQLINGDKIEPCLWIKVFFTGQTKKKKVFFTGSLFHFRVLI